MFAGFSLLSAIILMAIPTKRVNGSFLFQEAIWYLFSLFRTVRHPKRDMVKSFYADP